jgi:hypothetical protein
MARHARAIRNPSRPRRRSVGVGFIWPRRLGSEYAFMSRERARSQSQIDLTALEPVRVHLMARVNDTRSRRGYPAALPPSEPKWNTG